LLEQSAEHMHECSLTVSQCNYH